MKKVNSKTTIKTFITLILLCLHCYNNNLTAQHSVITYFTGFNGSYSGGTPQTDQNVISDGTYLYGMTNGGGVSGLGVIYKVLPDGTNYSVLMNFTGALTGSRPEGSFIYDGTYLYGMTSTGGTSDLGTLFKIKTDGTGYVKLKDFTGSLNGSTPKGSLIYDGTLLYGMTRSGGSSNSGTIFNITPSGTYTKLWNFTGGTGGFPTGSLYLNGGDLYGMTTSGGPIGAANGTIFKFQLIATVINENNLADSFLIYPNPSNGQVTIKIAEITGSCELSVHNLLGELVFSETIKENSTGISLNLKTGLYFVSLDNKVQKAIRKIIIE